MADVLRDQGARVVGRPPARLTRHHQVDYQVAVPILLPRAVDVLMKSPLADADYYPGDLLYAVVRLPDNVWDHLGVVRRRLADAIEPLASSDGAAEHLRLAIRQFVAAAPGR